jgi:hypothetical protein
MISDEFDNFPVNPESLLFVASDLAGLRQVGRLFGRALAKASWSFWLTLDLCQNVGDRGCTTEALRAQPITSGYTLVHRNIIEPHGTPWNPMECHRISWNLTKLCGTLWNPDSSDSSN